MDENPPPPETTGEPAVYWTPPRPGTPPKHPRGQRLLVGAIVTFVFASLLYGPGNVTQALVFATVCTLGIGLVAILFCCWLVGWLVMEVWDGLRAGRTRSAT